MKLIIDIDEQHFELLQMAVMNGMGDKAQKIIAQGIPLPKGHGRLIDADKLWDSYHDLDYDFYEALDLADTIIEADKGEQE